MSEQQRVDILDILGINHNEFTGDLTLTDSKKKPVARVFRRGGKIVYRAGTAVEWDDEDGFPVSRRSS